MQGQGGVRQTSLVPATCGQDQLPRRRKPLNSSWTLHSTACKSQHAGSNSAKMLAHGHPALTCQVFQLLHFTCWLKRSKCKKANASLEFEKPLKKTFPKPWDWQRQRLTETETDRDRGSDFCKNLVVAIFANKIWQYPSCVVHAPFSKFDSLNRLQVVRATHGWSARKSMDVHGINLRTLMEWLLVQSASCPETQEQDGRSDCGFACEGAQITFLQTYLFWTAQAWS